MPNQPVQIVLNPRQLRADRDRQGGGSHKDFFEGRDAAFKAHRATLAASLQDLAATLDSSSTLPSGLGFLAVDMRGDALAKSHRPQDALFKPTVSPHSATEKIGQPIYAVTPSTLAGIAQVVLAAEDHPEVREDANGVAKPRPSARRTEASAITAVRLWGEADKRSFSAGDAVAWLREGSAGINQYSVELFSTAGAVLAKPVADAWRLELRRLVELLKPLGVVASRTRGPGALSSNGLRLTLGIFEKPGESQLQLQKLSEQIERIPATAGGEISLDPVRHQQVIDALVSSPVVRRIELLPRVSAFDPPVTRPGSEAPAELFEVLDGALPKIGVVDCGISGPIAAWVAEERSYIAPADRDASHGTFIAGLLVAASDLNEYLVGFSRGCTLFDIAVLPANNGGTGLLFDSYYPDGVAGFMDEVESAVDYFRTTQDVRVYTFSINVEAAPGQLDYGYMARRLDDISSRLDVIFVISAGNLDSTSMRDEWAPNMQNALAELAGDRRGFLAQPGESLFNASVSALNPPGLEGQVPFALARYSRRGPGLRGAVKPDFAHIGGSGTPNATIGSGLFSVDTDGRIKSGAGTSYAGPLVARRIAELDAAIESYVPRETLLALTVHNATTPSHLSAKELKAVSRDVVGFGIPAAPSRVLEADDSGITIIVQTTLMRGEEHKLEFAWPASLVNNGKCRGYARLTLVARPVLAYQHGDERVRVNIDAKLMQQKLDGGYDGKLTSVFVADKPPRSGQLNERELLVESMKWQVIKSGHVRMPNGHGPTSRWKLSVEYLTRAGESFPERGVEYALVLDIRDLEGVAPVFQEMRAQLGSLGIQTSDIRTRVQERAQATP